MITAAGVILIITGIVAALAVPYKIVALLAQARTDDYREYLDIVSELAVSPWATAISIALLAVIVGGGVCALRRKARDWAIAGAVCSTIAMGFYGLLFAVPGVLATIFLLSGRRDFEMAEYDKAVKSDSCNAAAFCDRGEAYANATEYSRAISDYSRAIELDPGYALAYFNRAYAYGETSDYDKAIADYSKAIELDPSYALAYYNRALDYLNIGQSDKAIADMEKCIELSSGTELMKDAQQALHGIKSPR